MITTWDKLAHMKTSKRLQDENKTLQVEVFLRMKDYDVSFVSNARKWLENEVPIKKIMIWQVVQVKENYVSLDDGWYPQIFVTQ